MTLIPYDPTRQALFFAGRADDFFTFGNYADEAALCMELARVAYVKEETRLTHYLARAQFDVLYTFGYTGIGMQVYIAAQRNSARTVVVFRGSEPEDPSDIFADAEFTLSEWRDAAGNSAGLVHSGFAHYTRQERVFERVKAAIDPLPADRRVLITGHSLGAALATLMASWVPSAHLYTYGSPRVGTAAFKRALKNPTNMRYVNCCDVVCRVPPATPLGYVHVGTLAYINRKGKLLDSPSEKTMLDDRLKAAAEFLPHALVKGTVFSRDLADHAPINYVSGILGLRA